MTATPQTTDDSPWEFNRANPSPRYLELARMYREMHLGGDKAKGIPPEQMFSGHSLPVCAERIQGLIAAHGARTILDYGSGKGMQYGPMNINFPDGRHFDSIKDFWGVERIACYDAGYPPFSTLPTEKFDGVISTDVMEHIPEEDLPWILDEIFGYARKFVFGNIASYLALKVMPNGENAHCTVQPPEWWHSLIQVIAARHPHLRYRFDVDLIDPSPSGKGQHRVVTLEG